MALINIRPKLKSKLDDLKKVDSESYGSVIERMIHSFEEKEEMVIPEIPLEDNSDVKATADKQNNAEAKPGTLPYTDDEEEPESEAKPDEA